MKHGKLKKENTKMPRLNLCWKVITTLDKLLYFHAHTLFIVNLHNQNISVI